MNLNTRAREQNQFDAIVVGSGITGGWAAKELCEQGLKVLMLERGRTVEHPNYPTATKDLWDLEQRGRLLDNDRKNHHVQCRHYSFGGDNKHFYINDVENPYTEIERYDWIRADVVGGRSLLWGRHCYRWSDLDFEANAKDGVGIDWPIRYKDIAPWYDYVEKFVGISGNADGIRHLPDGVFQPPMEMNCVEQHFAGQIHQKFEERRVIIGRVANLTAPVKGRGVCQYRNLCHRGCPYGAYFSTNASTLPAAFETGNLTLRPHALVNRVLYDEQKQKAIGVEIIDTETGQTEEFYARLIFLNAATLATTFILLNSISSRFPEGLGNDSGQLGRNLMDHHKLMGMGASVDGFEDQYYSGRRANGIIIPRFRNVKEKSQSFLRGYNFMGGAGRGGWNRGSDQIGAALKEEMSTPGGWGMGFTGFGECLPYEDNRVTLNTTVKDKHGRNTLSIAAKFRENEQRMQEDMKESLREMLEAVGFKNINVNGRMSFPGNANHEMGTARMGKDPKTSVLNAFNQIHSVKNVFVTDGSCMTSAACVNPSLTYMALTVRACRFAIEEMKKQNL